MLNIESIYPQGPEYPNAIVENRFNSQYSILSASDLYAGLRDAVDYYFLQDPMRAPYRTTMLDYLARCRGIFTAQIDEHQRKAQQHADTQSPGPRPLLYPLMLTFVHDYILTPTALPTLPRESKEILQKRTHQILNQTDSEVRRSYVLQTALQYKPY